jgi:hypothetical protein
MIPFSYFYGDERIEDIQQKESEFKEKALHTKNSKWKGSN